MSSYDGHAWLFPGQGSQEIGMGRALLERFPAARDVMMLAEEFSGHPLGTIIQRGPDAKLTQTDVLQPALVAISIGYVELLKHTGVEPVAVAGHSLGEISALYAAEVISLADALRLGAERGRLMSQSAQGGMLAVKDLSPEKITELIGHVEGTVVLANFNAIGQTVVSGEHAALDALVPLVSAAGASSVRLNVSGAWHSPLVQEAAGKFQEVLSSVEFATPRVPLVLGATGQVAHTAEEIRSVMMRQIVSPVRWTQVTSTLLGLGVSHFLEVGPGKVLRGLLRKNVDPTIKYTVAGVDNSKTVTELLSTVAQES